MTEGGLADCLAEDRWLTAQLGTPCFAVRSPSSFRSQDVPPGPSFLSARVPVGDVTTVQALEGLGFRMVEVSVTLEGSPESRGAGADVGSAGQEDADAVAAIARSSLRQSRFHLDPHIGSSVADAIKEAWARNYFHGGRGDEMLVGRVGGRVVGFALLIHGEGVVIVDLIAVAAEHRSAGLGAAMLRTARSTSREWPRMRAGTQLSNLGAVKFYRRLGLDIVAADLVLHRHGG